MQEKDRAFDYKITCGDSEAEVSEAKQIPEMLSLFRSLSLDTIKVFKREQGDWKLIKEIGKCMNVESK
jgi:hypothetical protein